jgi:hypothetical protein
MPVWYPADLLRGDLILPMMRKAIKIGMELDYLGAVKVCDRSIKMIESQGMVLQGL